MGKIRIKTLGTTQEETQKEKTKVKREEKKKRLTKVPGLKGGQRIVDMTSGEVPKTQEPEAGKKGKKKGKIKKQKGEKYLSAKKMVDPLKIYPFDEAVKLLRKVSYASFDETVEVHLTTTEKNIRGQVVLPHGTGKEIKVAIAADDLISEIEKGKIDFDVLLASPTIMPKLAKVAKILGPRGLMPNPKNGTISDKPEELAEKLKKGQIQFKTESNFPLIHQTIGKLSFPDRKLKENFEAFVSALGREKIQKMTLKSTMSPGIKVVFV